MIANRDQLLFEIICRGRDGLGSHIFRQTSLQACQLRAYVLNLINRVVDAIKFFANSQLQAQLLVEIGLADLHPRVQFHFQWRGLSLRPHREADLITSGRGHGTACSAAVFPEVVAGDAVCLLITQIPHKPVQTSFRFKLLFRFLVVGIKRLFGHLKLSTRVLPNDAA